MEKLFLSFILYVGKKIAKHAIKETIEEIIRYFFED